MEEKLDPKLIKKVNQVRLVHDFKKILLENNKKKFVGRNSLNIDCIPLRMNSSKENFDKLKEMKIEVLKPTIKKKEAINIYDKNKNK